MQIGGRLWPASLARSTLAITIIGGVALFVATTPDLLSPGLAGTELLVTFGAGVFTGAALSLIGGMPCRPRRATRFDQPAEHRLPIADYGYRALRPPNAGGPLVLVLPDPDLPGVATLPVVSAILDSGYTCAVVSWGREGVPRYPDAMAVVPMLISIQAGDGPVAVVGLGASGDLALRSAADDERIALAMAVGPALRPANVLSGLLLLREMNVAEAWRWQRKWHRQGFIASLQAGEALCRLGRRGAILASRHDGFYHWSEECESAARAGARMHILDGESHEGLVRGVAPAWVNDMLTAARSDLVAIGGEPGADPVG